MKKYLFPLILICIIICCSIPVQAHPDAREHDKELESVLFVEGYSKRQSEDIKNAVRDLEYASNLTIDQFGGKGRDKFKTLQRELIIGFPVKFSSVDYKYVING